MSKYYKNLNDIARQYHCSTPLDQLDSVNQLSYFNAEKCCTTNLLDTCFGHPLVAIKVVSILVCSDHIAS